MLPKLSIKGIHNTVADAISRLEYNTTLNLTAEYSHITMRIPTAEPSKNPKRWKAFSKHWCSYNQCHITTDTTLFRLDQVSANRSEEEEIYPLTTKEIAEAQKADAKYKHLFQRNAVFDQGLEIKLVENTLCVPFPQTRDAARQVRSANLRMKKGPQKA